MNSITEFLDLEDADITISDTVIQGTKKFLTIETVPKVHYCPTCSFRMHSRGIKKRTISHPILQDNYELILILKQRRWRCTNPDCRYEFNESFRFVSKNRRCTNTTDMLIVQEYKNLDVSSAAIAQKYHKSDTYVLDVFERYVKMDRLPLTDIISIDEVFLNIDSKSKYALVIQDFYTGDPIDLLRSRRVEVTEPYFTSIPMEERRKVRYLICDMYNQYINYVDKYFPNAVPVVDSFHVMQWIIRSLDNYMRQLLRKYRQRDKERLEKLIEEKGRYVKVPVSNEVHLLQKYRWLVLANQSNITYRSDSWRDKHFKRLMNTYDYEYALFRIDPKLEDLRELKEIYVRFNTRNAGNPEKAMQELPDIITLYRKCPYEIFHNFADLLESHMDPIINSFIMVQKNGPGGIYDSRLSNGPIESLNRKVKDLKRLGRGFRNFEHFRNRFLYATRNQPCLNGVSDYNPVQYFSTDDE